MREKNIAFWIMSTMKSKEIEDSNDYVRYTWDGIDKMKQLLSNQ